MKKSVKIDSSNILTIVLTTALISLLTLTIIRENNLKTNTEETKNRNNMENTTDSCAIVLNNIHQRKSVRQFTSKQVSRTSLEVLAKAGMAAPTAMNIQLWHIIAIDNRATLDTLAAALPNASMLSQATAAIIVCGDTTKALEGEAHEYWVQDCSAATENILLATEAMEMGAVWTGAYPVKERTKTIQNIMKLNEDIVPLNVIAIGYPAENKEPKMKWDSTKYHYNQW